MSDSEPTIAYTQRALQRVLDAKFAILLDMSQHYESAQTNYPEAPELQFLEQLVSSSVEGIENLKLSDHTFVRCLLENWIKNKRPLPIWVHVVSGVLDMMDGGGWPPLTCMGLALKTERSESPIGIFLNKTGVHGIGDHSVSPPEGCRTFLDSFYRITREIVGSAAHFSSFEKSLPGLLHYGIRLTNFDDQIHPSGSNGYYVNINVNDIQQKLEYLGSGLRSVPTDHGHFVKFLVSSWLYGENLDPKDKAISGEKQICLYRQYLASLTADSATKEFKFDTYIIPALAWIRNPREFAVSANCYFAFSESLSENQALLLFSATQSMLTGLAQFSSINDITRQEQNRKKEILEIEQHKNVQLRRLVERWSEPFRDLSSITREIAAIVAPPAQLLLSQYQSLVSLFDPQTVLRIGERDLFQIAHEPDDYHKREYTPDAARLVLAVAVGRCFNLDETDQKSATRQSYSALVGHTLHEYLCSEEVRDPMVRLSKTLNWLLCGHEKNETIDQLLLNPANTSRCINALSLLKKAVVSCNKLDDPKWPIQGIMLALLGSPTHFQSTFSFTKGNTSVKSFADVKNGSYHLQIRPGDSPLTCPDVLVFLSEISNYAADHGYKISSVNVKASLDKEPLNCEIGISFDGVFYLGAASAGIDPARFEEEMIPRSEFTARGDFTGMFQRLFARIKARVEWEHKPTGSARVEFAHKQSRSLFSVVVDEKLLQLIWSQKTL